MSPARSSRLLYVAPLLAVAALGFAVVAVAPGARFAVLTLGALGLVATAFLGRLQGVEARWLQGMLFLAAGIRLFTFALLREVVDPILFAPDAAMYEDIGRLLVEAWAGERPLPARFTESIQVGFLLINGFLFRLFGIVPEAPAMVNVFLGSWTIVPVHHLASRVCRGHQGVARWAATLAALFPSLILWSVLNIREAPTILLIVTAIYFAVRFQQDGRLRDAAGFLIPLFLLLLLREYLMGLVGVSAAAGISMGRSGHPVRAFAGGAVILMVVTFALQTAGMGSSLAREPSLERVELLRQDLALGAGSAYGTDADVSTVGGALQFLPVGLTYFLLAPFPWSVTSVLQAVTLPESILWYVLLLFGFRGLWLALTRDPRAYMVVLAVLVTVTFSYALVEGNVGTAYRHRAQVLPLFFVFIAVGLQDVVAARRERRQAAKARRKSFQRPAVRPGLDSSTS